MKNLIKAIIVTLIILLISCEKQVFVESEEKEILSYGKILIESIPGPAQVYIDGRNSGFTTLDTIKFISVGSHKITLRQNLFKDTTLIVSVDDKFTAKIIVDYFKNPGHFGKVYCNSSPTGALIYLDGKSTNLLTPNTLSYLFPGEHQLKFTKAEYRSDSIKVYAKGGTTVNALVSLEDTSKWVNYNINNSPITANHLSSIVVDKNNIKWIGTRDQGLCSFDGKNWKIFKKENSPLIYDFINFLAVDEKNNLWIATTGGLMMKNGNNWIDYSSHLPSTYVTSIAFDKAGNTWIGTMNGLVKFNGSTWQVYNINNSEIPGNFVTTISIGNDNKIWVGTSANGLAWFDGLTWKTYLISNMKIPRNLGNSIRYIKVDNDGIVWVAHLQNLIVGDLGGFTKFDGVSWTDIKLVGVPSDQIETIYVDSKNNKWVGTKNGLGKFLQTFSVTAYTTINSAIPASQIVGVAIDAYDDLFVATFGGGLGKGRNGKY